MKTVLVAAMVLMLAGTAMSVTFIHVHRTSQTELGITCSNGGDPTVVGNEESTLIISCGTIKGK